MLRPPDLVWQVKEIGVRFVPQTGTVGCLPPCARMVFFSIKESSPAKISGASDASSFIRISQLRS